ncbi:hypothetical protein IW262DRAFT_1453468 [Armillaria fumosa]|nr:hypothetical protein IW262DRAFT_1453468 [Armillaria fumosa]
MDDCTISEELSVKGDACSSLGSNTCPNLQTVSAAEPSEPSDSSSDSSESSLSSSEMSDSSGSSSDTSMFVSAHLMEGTSSYNGSSVANWAVDNKDYSTDSSIDERMWQEQYQGEGEQYDVCLTNLEEFETEGDVPVLLRAPLNNIFPDGECMLNIGRISRLDGLSPVKHEFYRIRWHKSKIPLEVSDILLPYVPWDPPMVEQQTGRWIFDDFAHGIVCSLEEKLDAAESYGCYEAPLPRAFGDSVAQHL